MHHFRYKPQGGAVAAGHELTAKAAADVLYAGGNAADAAIAALLMTWVAEPCMSSAGGGTFATVYTHTGKAFFVNGFCQTPRYKRPLSEVEFYPVEVDFGDAHEVFHIGKGATGVPGSVASVFALHQLMGTIPMKELVQPAIQAAKDGVAVTDFLQFNFELLDPIMRASATSRDLFFKQGLSLKQGDHFYMPELADFMDYLACEGQAAFYRGEVANRIATDYQQGGYLTLKDLENYQVQMAQPLRFPYRDRTVLTTPYPGIGGAIIGLTLGFLEQMFDSCLPYQSSDYIRQLHRVFEQVDALGKQPDALHRAVQAWQRQHWGSTTHFSIADRQGNAISLTTTNGEGSGYFVPGTGVHLNNMLGEKALLPEGFHSWQPNARLTSMMAPTIVLDAQQRPEIVIGTGGAGRIAFAISQVLHLLIDHGLSLLDAIHAPRVHLGHHILHLEAGFDDLLSASEVSQTLKRWSGQSMFFGGINALKRQQGEHWDAIGDERRKGVGYIL